MAAIIVTKELHSSTNILIFNLSLADISISAFVDTFTVVGKFYRKINNRDYVFTNNLN